MFPTGIATAPGCVGGARQPSGTLDRYRKASKALAAGSQTAGS